MIVTRRRFNEYPDNYKATIIDEVLRGRIEGIESYEFEDMLKFVVMHINKNSKKKYQVIEIQPEKPSSEIGGLYLPDLLGSIERRKNNYEPLTEDEFKIIWVLHENNYSHASIAEIMKISRNTVKKALDNNKRYEIIKLFEEDALASMKRRYGLK